MRAFGRYRQPGARIRALAGLVWAMACLLGASSVRASVALLLEEPYGHMGMLNPTGHSAIYLDTVCAATPLRLRPCRPGELGVVISRYDGIGHHDWVAVPLIPYLYAVDRPEEIPVSVRQADVEALRESYRRRHLSDVAPDLPNGSAPDGNWYELVGSAYDRTLYGLQVRSTPEQDAELIALFNDRRNIELYNGMFRNCADFARVTLNRFYPHAVRRNFIADFGMTTPKSVARALTHYAGQHPEVDLQVFQVPQVSGDLPRSQGVQGVAESLLKEYGLPLVVLSPASTAAMLVAYVGHGRFAEPRDAPVLNLRVGLTMPDSVTPASLGKPEAAERAMRAGDMASYGEAAAVVMNVQARGSEGVGMRVDGGMAAERPDNDGLKTVARFIKGTSPER